MKIETLTMVIIVMLSMWIGMTLKTTIDKACKPETTNEQR